VRCSHGRDSMLTRDLTPGGRCTGGAACRGSLCRRAGDRRRLPVPGNSLIGDACTTSPAEGLSPAEDSWSRRRDVCVCSNLCCSAMRAASLRSRDIARGVNVEVRPWVVMQQ
jgi:hypothetical protein